MMSVQAPDRWQEILKIFRDINNQYFYKILAGSIAVLVFGLIGKNIFAREPGYDTNIFTEILGVLFTIVVLNTLAERRRVKDLQERLIFEAGCQSNEAAKLAVDELRWRGWLTGENGLLQNKTHLTNAKLKGADLRKANLSESRLKQAELQGANLWGANLHRTHLDYANLVGADLQYATLKSAFLWNADLRNANLRGANLLGANLQYAKLQGANLEGANLLVASLSPVQFDETTILPDGTHWTRETADPNLERFTHSTHPQYDPSHILKPPACCKE